MQRASGAGNGGAAQQFLNRAGDGLPAVARGREEAGGGFVPNAMMRRRMEMLKEAMAETPAIVAALSSGRGATVPAAVTVAASQGGGTAAAAASTALVVHHAAVCRTEPCGTPSVLERGGRSGVSSPPLVAPPPRGRASNANGAATARSATPAPQQRRGEVPAGFGAQQQTLRTNIRVPNLVSITTNSQNRKVFKVNGVNGREYSITDYTNGALTVVGTSFVPPPSYRSSAWAARDAGVVTGGGGQHLPPASSVASPAMASSPPQRDVAVTAGDTSFLDMADVPEGGDAGDPPLLTREDAEGFLSGGM